MLDLIDAYLAARERLFPHRPDLPGKRWLQAATGWRANTIAFGLGTLAAAALPPLHGIPVLLACVPGLIWLINAAPSGWAAFRRGFWFSFGNNLLGLYWITEAILIEAARYWWLVPLAVPALSALMALFVAVPCGVCRLATPGWRRIALLSGLWVVFDVGREFIGTGFPWNPWGSVWAIPGATGDAFIQLAALVGVHGLTLVTLLLASTPALGWRFMAAGGVGVGLWLGFGEIRLSSPPADTTPSVGVVLVQGNVPQGAKWARASASTVFERYLDLTQQGVAEARQENRTVVVIWPETASPYWLDRDQYARAAIWAAAQPAAAILAGSVRFNDAGRPLNSLFAISGVDSVSGIYDKRHLVPFGEFAPSWIPFAVQLVPGVSFLPGEGPRTIKVDGIPPFGGLICYEAIYSAQVVDELYRPSWLVNITNDAWFGNSAGPRQHLAAARLRAVEEGLPLVRAANTGITAAFDATGHEIGRIPMNVASTLVVSLPPPLPQTPYARLGLIIPLALAAVSCSCGFGFLLSRSKRH